MRVQQEAGQAPDEGGERAARVRSGAVKRRQVFTSGNNLVEVNPQGRRQRGEGGCEEREESGGAEELGCGVELQGRGVQRMRIACDGAGAEVGPMAEKSTALRKP